MARVVLDDCRKALDRYQTNEFNEYWRIDWCLVLTLLRAVGHVLDRVDGKASAIVKQVQSKHWSDWEQERVFSDFIKLGRDNLVKEYEINNEKKGGGLLKAPGGGLVRAPNGGILAVPTRRLISHGHFKGQRAAATAHQAIEWWDAKLSLIEAELEAP